MFNTMKKNLILRLTPFFEELNLYKTSVALAILRLKKYKVPRHFNDCPSNAYIHKGKADFSSTSLLEFDFFLRTKILHWSIWIHLHHITSVLIYVFRHFLKLTMHFRFRFSKRPCTELFCRKHLNNFLTFSTSVSLKSALTFRLRPLSHIVSKRWMCVGGKPRRSGRLPLTALRGRLYPSRTRDVSNTGLGSPQNKGFHLIADSGGQT